VVVAALLVPAVLGGRVSEQEVVTARRNRGEFKMELTRNID
jgi:hypothetical protein